MSFITIEFDLSVIDKVSRSAFASTDDYVSLVTNRDGDLVVVGDATEEGVVAFISSLEKEVVMEYWGDDPLEDAL